MKSSHYFLFVLKTKKIELVQNQGWWWIKKSRRSHNYYYLRSFNEQGTKTRLHTVNIGNRKRKSYWTCFEQSIQLAQWEEFGKLPVLCYYCGRKILDLLVCYRSLSPYQQQECLCCIGTLSKLSQYGHTYVDKTALI